MRTLRERARSGTPLWIPLRDPDRTCVAARGSDEGVGESMAAKTRKALVHCRALPKVDGVEIRLHDTVPYNSIFQADDDLLINPHAYGIAASRAPVLHVRRAEDGDMASTYLRASSAFELRRALDREGSGEHVKAIADQRIGSRIPEIRRTSHKKRVNVM
ncbi:XRE family transcriptional regulator [Actinomadura verrucosospora]|uniref:XRE family transcriptional regulator n=1 Tax=Actinomadura verrucosospora TaxID=46165 RepID=A0A7D4ABF0_ACTVE|nr:XRE family transcriptional regulator [Actinomadura verrucosospora]